MPEHNTHFILSDNAFKFVYLFERKRERGGGREGEWEKEKERLMMLKRLGENLCSVVLLDSLSCLHGIL